MDAATAPTRHALAIKHRCAPGRVCPTLPTVNDAPSSDETLMRAYAAGDDDAFAQLYARHRGPLYRFIVRGLGDRAVAEEIYQETWMRVIQARARWHSQARFSTWLTQIAANLVIDAQRRTRPTAGGAETEAVLAQLDAPAEQRPDQELGRFEQARRLQQALAALPSEQRVAFLMRAEQGMGVEAIAEATGVGHETAKSRLRYAFARLREYLQ